MSQGYLTKFVENRNYYIDNKFQPNGWWTAGSAYVNLEGDIPCSGSGIDRCYNLKNTVSNYNNLFQPTSGYRPIWNSGTLNGNPTLTFDGVNYWIGGSTNGVISSPSYDWLFLIVFRQLSWTTNDQIWNNGTQYFRQNASTPNLGMSSSSDWTNIASGQWVVMSFRGTAYDATSLGVRQYKNLESETTSIRKNGSYGNFSSLSLGGSSVGTFLSNIEFAESILFFGIIPEYTRQAYVNSLMQKYNIT